MRSMLSLFVCFYFCGLNESFFFCWDNKDAEYHGIGAHLDLLTVSQLYNVISIRTKESRQPIYLFKSTGRLRQCATFNMQLSGLLAL